MAKDRILIVDDEKLIASSLTSMLNREGFDVETGLTGRDGLRKFQLFQPQLVLLDIALPDIDGLDLLRRLKEADRETPVIMMTAYASAEATLQALENGAADFFGKPFNLEALKQGVRRSLTTSGYRNPEPKTAPELRRNVGEQKMVGNSPGMISVFKLIRAAADADAKTVLVTGESGTGKELVARAIHCHSARAGAPFIEVNCASIPENLLENELFGHEKGAYTDASRRHLGVFGMAQGGTLFLDEIGDMPLAMQAKVLKAIDTRRFRRLGGQEELAVDVRIVAATHQNLTSMVSEGKFRADLFFRLKVMHIELPPLRERVEDIVPLVQYLIETLNAEYGRTVAAAEPETLRELAGYRWPGNVRELRNVIERLMMFERGDLLPPDHLPPEIRGGRDAIDPEETAGAGSGGDQILFPPSGLALEELERLLIEKALIKSGGNLSRAARFLKTSRDTLRYRVKKYGLRQGH